MVRVVGGRGFVDVSRPIAVVYREGVVEMGLGVELEPIGGKPEGVGVMRRRRIIRQSGSGVFWVSLYL